ncbi:hypothetical protein FOZ62_025997 [Perkinsus olseni]|uniref:Uncharacterized protein n=1 Tax=Perkinsus olseni TaxID=32597 RepID=A0A7J6U5Q4_PEROL|nr:hypothetical protein FOZ62_025997 [Perkinsus olseni]
MSTKQIIVATAAVVAMVSNLPTGVAIGGTKSDDDFPELREWNTTWCRFTNKDISSSRKALMVSIKEDISVKNRLWTDFITCPKNDAHDAFNIEFLGGGLYKYYAHGHPLWWKAYGKDAQPEPTIYGRDRTYLHDPVGHCSHYPPPHAKTTDDPKEFCLSAMASLKKEFGTFAAMCVDFYRLLKRAQRPPTPQGLDEVG